MPEVTLRPDSRVWARSALGSAEVVAGSTLAHAIAASSSGEAGPSAVSALALALPVIPLTALVLRHKMALRVALPVLVGTQFLAHLVLSSPHGTHGPHGLHAAADPAHVTWQMALAHVSCAVLTLAVWRLRRRALEAAISWPAAHDVAVAVSRHRAWRDRAVVVVREWRFSRTLRGPPSPHACTGREGS